MERVKLFAGYDVEKMEARMNEWMESNNIKIVRVLQNAATDAIGGRTDVLTVISIFYRTYKTIK